MLISESTSDRIVHVAKQASSILLQYFNTELKVNYKDDRSPVTEADHAANDVIVSALKELTPHIPIISEESEQHAEVGETFWLIDPLDGTRAFVAGKPEFSVNIGLIHQRKPVYGVLAVPPHGSVYVGGEGIAPYKQLADGTRLPLLRREKPEAGLRVLKSSAHTSKQMQAYLDTLEVAQVAGMSSALKFGLVAEGLFDIYPRFGRTMEWDTASGHAIINAVGGSITTMDGAPFLYNKPGFENGGFIAYGWQ